MVKDKQIQELEIQVSATGVKAAEAKIARLEKRKARWEKEFKGMKSGKSAREKEFREYRTLNRKEIWEQEFRKRRAGKIAREEIAIEKHRVSALKKSIMERTGKGKGSGFASLDRYRRSTLLERRKREWGQQFQEMRVGKTARTGAFLQGKVDSRQVDWKRQFAEMRVDKTAREKKATGYQETKARITRNIEANRARRGFGLNRKYNLPTTEQNSAFRKTNKLLRARIKIEKMLAKTTGKTNKDMEKGGAGRRSGGGLVGKTMLYLGAATMIQYMAGSAFQGALALGDTAANVESNVLKGRAFQDRYAKTVGDTGFDDAVNLYSKLSGQSSFLARAQMAEIAGSLEAAGVMLKGEQLTGVARATRGLSGGMGISEEMASQKILGLLSGRISAQEAGLVGVKRSSDPSKTLDSILKFMEKNAVTAAVMKADTMSSIMARIRTAPLGLMASIFDEAPEQMKSGMRVFGDWVDSFFGTQNQGVVNEWGRTMAQFTTAMKNVFGGDAGDFSKQMSVATSGLIKGIEITAKALQLVAKDPKKAIATYAGYKVARKLGLPTARKIPAIAAKGIFSSKLFGLGLLGLLTKSTATDPRTFEELNTQFEGLNMEQFKRREDTHGRGAPSVSSSAGTPASVQNYYNINNAYIDKENVMISDEIISLGGTH